MYILLLKFEVITDSGIRLPANDWRQFNTYEEAKAELEKLKVSSEDKPINPSRSSIPQENEKEADA